ncbi:hypothetical protein PENTCL1PPCAC_7503, partial [Pristionchus entomophagus]
SMLVLLLSALPIATLIALGCAAQKKAPPLAGGHVSSSSGSAPAAVAPTGGEKTGDNRTASDGMSQTGATGGGTQAVGLASQTKDPVGGPSVRGTGLVVVPGLENPAEASKLGDKSASRRATEKAAAAADTAAHPNECLVESECMCETAKRMEAEWRADRARQQ